MSVPIATSPGRAGFGPQLSISYDSGSGNGPFGLGWNLSLPSITRKTEKGLPKYQDGDESDTFILSGAEDLVPVLKKQGNDWVPEDVPDRTIGTETYRIKRYRPRIEGLFARIERWTNTRSNETHWRSISRDNITTVYGRTTDSRIEESEAPEGFPRVFSWLICESYDDKGNAIYYEYAPEDSAGIDLSQTNERNRTNKNRSANRYLKRIKYGNKTPFNHDSDLPREFREDLSERTDWLFEVVFDYEQGHCEELPADPDGRQFVNAHINPAQDWQRRQDPFSSYRSGFEVRTYRLCHSVLMFHHFPDELGVEDYLVRSTEFKYQESPIASFITSVTQSGYKLQDDGSYLKKSLPPLEFEYSKATIQDKVQDVDEESIENLPQGLDGAQYQWADIDGEGLSGILTEQGDSWFYKRNVSALPVIGEDCKPHIAARFTPTERLATIPSYTNLSEGRQQLLDLAGDGQLDVVEFDSPTPGFYERTKGEAWQTFKPFESLPNISWQDPNLKFVDLTGDGHADIFITEDDAFTWYPSLAETGFASGEKVRQALDEEKGPKLVFADGTQSIFLADISGDGLTDLVRIRNGEVCYWPNLGYGRFGTKVTMDNSPLFDAPDHFDQRRIRLADIDGSGVTDIIYLNEEGVYIYLNESGNRWADAEKLKSFPQIDNLSSVMAVDLLGNGTACLIWSSPLPGANGKPLRYIDLMGGQKPHLLVKTVNNLGAETHVHYAPSTKFYLADKLAGKPWITRIPFPVHVIERVETFDCISRNRFVSRYAYHHGYFDGEEREFRGFGMVEQWDTEEYAALSESQDFPIGDNIEESSHIPPVLTKTWFHTGAFIKQGRISRQFEQEYYREGDPSLAETGLSDEQLQAMLLEDTILPENLSSAESHEACRALKGSILRQEIYGLDRTEKEDRPYTVYERNYTLQGLQPRGKNKHAVFSAHARETIDFHYERKLYDFGNQKLADPRVTHTITLAVDNYGNVLRSSTVSYGRRHDDPNPILTNYDRIKQKRSQIIYAENSYTNPILEDDNFRTPLLCETRIYELLNIAPSSNLPDVTNLFRFEELQNRIQEADDGLHDIPYEDVNAVGAVENHPYRRLIEHIRSLYRSNDLVGPLSRGELESRALVFETYKLAFTPGLIAEVYKGRVTDNMLENEGGYIHNEGDNNWWIPSGEIFYSPDNSDTFAQELSYAHKHFFLPHRFKDPFEQIATVQYDPYDLLIQETCDELGNRVTAGERDTNNILTVQGNNYRVLQPTLLMDSNRNRSKVIFDALGMVVGTAVMAKPEENLGDTLDGFESDLTDMVITDHLQNPLADPHSILQQATTRMIYDFSAFQHSQTNPEPQPIVIYTLKRETHDADLAPGQQTKIQHSFSYSDGFGREIQKKIQVEPGDIDGVFVSQRWITSGWIIFNNKGKPVRQYEPFFDNKHDFKFGKQVGVSPIIFYDPLERVIATLHPNHTFEKVVFDPWHQKNWDVNDTVLENNPKNDPDVGDFFRRLSSADYLPTWHALRTDPAYATEAIQRWPDPKIRNAEKDAAVKASIHTATPTIAYFDSLKRVFLIVVHNKYKHSNTPVPDPPTEEFCHKRVIFDIEGNQQTVIDAKDRIIMCYDYSIVKPEEDENNEPTNTNLIHQASMEAGERWILNDVVGKPIRSWNSRNHQVRTTYDQLRRPINSYLHKGSGQELLVERTIYGESQLNPEANNLRGKVVELFNQTGVVTSNNYDFKGNLLSRQWQLAQEYKTILDWSTNVALEASIYTSRTLYDVLNRPTQLTAPHSNQQGTKINVIQLTYNESNLLEQVNAWLNQSTEPTNLLEPATANLNVVTNINYNAKGQRTQINYGNEIKTTYEYNPLTFRLVHMHTQRNLSTFPGDCPQPPPAGWPGCQVQNLHYMYDPVGNITHIRDASQQTIYFRNKRVEPSANYTYDALYRLIEATGREHLSQINGVPIPHSHNDAPRIGINWSNNDGKAMGTYIERYLYDAVGNFLEMQHRGNDPVHPGWTRKYHYSEPSFIEPAKTNNRLSSTQIGSELTLPYTYDEHGNMTSMPHLPLMLWDFEDQLQATSKIVVNNGGTPETTFYVYDATGQRVRKITERQSLAGQTPTRKSECIYLDDFEIYRDYEPNGSTIKLERETLHIMDDQKRIALVETKTIDTTNNPSPKQLIRYQLNNHLGSASLEIDDKAQIISYEEYTPYGSSSYQAVRNQIETSKRYRYTGKEHDEESGLYYYGIRYYASWLGRWTSTDPIGIEDGVNVYEFTRGNPIILIDPSGKSSERITELKQKRAELTGALEASRETQAFWEERREWRLARPYLNKKKTEKFLAKAAVEIQHQETIQSDLNKQIKAIDKELESLRPKRRKLLAEAHASKPKETTPKKTKRKEVEFCTGPAGIEWMRKVGIPHDWLRTPNKEAGLGAPPGKEISWLAEVQIRSHKGRGDKPGSVCVPVYEEYGFAVDLECVDAELTEGRDLGTYGLTNNCWSIVDDIVAKCQTWNDPPFITNPNAYERYSGERTSGQGGGRPLGQGGGRPY